LDVFGIFAGVWRLNREVRKKERRLISGAGKGECLGDHGGKKKPQFRHQERETLKERKRKEKKRLTQHEEKREILNKEGKGLKIRVFEVRSFICQT